MTYRLRITLILVCGSLCASATSVKEAVKYQDELYLANEGVIYVQAKLKKGPAFEEKTPKSRILRIDLYHETRQSFYSFDQKFIANKSDITEAYLLPVGNYRLVKASVVDDDGVERVWYLDTSDVPVIRVRASTVSNLGKWIVEQAGKDRLEIEFLAAQNRFVLADASSRGGIKTAIDGFTGVVQEISAAYNPVVTADYGHRGEVVGNYNYGRDVFVSYELNLFREAQFANLLKSGIDRDFDKLSGCYSTTVGSNAGPQGKMLVSFVASPATQGLKNLRVQRADFRHPTLQKCVTARLQEIKINIPKSLLGTITLNFQVDDGSISAH